MFLGGGPLQEDDSDSGIAVGEEVDEDNGTLLAVFSELAAAVEECLSPDVGF